MHKKRFIDLIGIQIKLLIILRASCSRTPCFNPGINRLKPDFSVVHGLLLKSPLFCQPWIYKTYLKTCFLTKNIIIDTISFKKLS